MEIENRMPDFISFLDDDGKDKQWYVEIIEIGTFVKFKTKEGNTVSIPHTRVLKVKEGGGLK